MKISILLPYKENFSPNYPGAVSLYVKDTTNCSIYKKNIYVYGSTEYKKKLLTNYVNLPFSKELFKSSSKIYVNNFLTEEKKKIQTLLKFIIDHRMLKVSLIIPKVKLFFIFTMTR